MAPRKREMTPDEVAYPLRREPGLPVENFSDAAVHLRRPFTPEAIKFKLQSAWKDKSGGLVVPYIDARLVIERLNLVCPAAWFDAYDASVGAGFLLCRLTVFDIPRVDIGQTRGEGPKGLYSDAFKRAAVKFGVGVSLYTIPKLALKVGEGNGQLRKNGKGEPVIDDRTDAALRKGYARWLDEHGIEKFGQPLDHGDVEGAAGDPEDPDAQGTAGDAENAGDEPEALPQLTDKLAGSLRQKAEAAHKALPSDKRLLPAEFKQRLAEAGTSHEALAAFLLELQARAEQ